MRTLPRAIRTTPILLGLASSLSAQAPEVEWTVEVAPEEAVSVVEAELTVSPADPRFLVAAAMTTDAESSFVYASRDGGRTWSAAGRFPGGDPALAFDQRGRALFSTITPEIRLWTSDDAARWTPWAPTERGFDRQWIAADPSGSHGILVAAKTPDPNAEWPAPDFPALVRWSTDRSTPAVATLATPSRGFLHTVTDLAFDRRGTLYLPYFVNLGGTGERPGELEGWLRIRTSPDGGETWEGPFDIAARRSYANSNWELAMMGLGGGELALDESGGGEPAAYVVWPNAVRARYRIEIARSPDGGRTWAALRPVAPSASGAHQSTPAVTVTGDGNVVVTWYDRDGDPEERCFRPRIAVSRDGGQSFDAATISERRTCMAPRSRWLNGGDTQGLEPVADDAVVATWIGQREGRTRLMASRVRLP